MKRAAALLLLTAACGSWSTQFRPRDGGAAVRPTGRDPDVYVHNVPIRRYSVAGIIEVHAPVKQAMEHFVPRAVAHARTLGCELIVVRHLHLARLRPVLVAQLPSGGQITRNPAGEVLGHEVPPRKRYDFVCGVYDRA